MRDASAVVELAADEYQGADFGSDFGEMHTKGKSPAAKPVRDRVKVSQVAVDPLLANRQRH